MLCMHDVCACGVRVCVVCVCPPGASEQFAWRVCNTLPSRLMNGIFPTYTTNTHTHTKTDWLDSLMRETGESVETDMTESILSEARDVALDILEGMRTVAVTHASEAEELQSMFDAR